MNVPIRILAATLALLATPTQAQVFCGPRAEVLAALAARYGETPRGAGLSHDGVVVELLVAPGGGWSLLNTYPSGVSCLAGAGEGWGRAAPQGGTQPGEPS